MRTHPLNVPVMSLDSLLKSLKEERVFAGLINPSKSWPPIFVHCLNLLQEKLMVLRSALFRRDQSPDKLVRNLLLCSCPRNAWSQGFKAAGWWYAIAGGGGGRRLRGKAFFSASPQQVLYSLHLELLP